MQLLLSACAALLTHDFFHVYPFLLQHMASHQRIAIVISIISGGSSKRYSLGGGKKCRIDSDGRARLKE